LNLRAKGRVARRAHVQLASFYIEREDRNQALEHLSLNIADDPKSPRAFFLKGQANLIFEQYESSLDDYEEAVRLGGSNAELRKLGENLANVFTSRGEALRVQGRRWPAVSEFNRAIRADSEYPSAYRERGLAYRDIGLVGLAMADFENALRLDPVDEKARELLSTTSREANGR
jgi:tetratricopeptide (TPR) repeat protein